MDSTIALRGFENLDSIEIQKVQEMISRSIKKIALKEDYQELIIELKQHQHSKEFIHEIKATIFLKDKRISSQSSDKNLYKALNSVLDKLLSELRHKLKNTRK